MSYRYCIVPKCSNTTSKTPEKLFFRVPSDEKRRKKWCKVMKRDDKTPFSTKTPLYCCEDHFDVKMPAHKLVNDEQLELLVSLVEESRDHILTNSNSTAARTKLMSLWSQITSRLNNVPNGVTKSPNKWREYWSERKYIARKKAKEYEMMQREGLAHVPSKYGVITPLDQRILDIIELANKEKKEVLKDLLDTTVKRNSKRKILTILNTKSKQNKHNKVSNDHSYYLSDFDEPITFKIEEEPSEGESEPAPTMAKEEPISAVDNGLEASPTDNSTSAIQEMTSAMRAVAKEMGGLRQAIDRISHILESRLPQL